MSAASMIQSNRLKSLFLFFFFLSFVVVFFVCRGWGCAAVAPARWCFALTWKGGSPWGCSWPPIRTQLGGDATQREVTAPHDLSIFSDKTYPVGILREVAQSAQRKGSQLPVSI
jgi:hypothetical protein